MMRERAFSVAQWLSIAVRMLQMLAETLQEHFSQQVAMARRLLVLAGSRLCLEQ